MSDWNNGMFGCMSDTGVCCDVICCPTCQLARTHAASNGVPNDANWVCCLILTIGGGCTSGLIPWIAMCQQRGKIRSTHGLAGGSIGDCCWTLCCPGCAMCQHHNELLSRGVPPGHCCCAPKKAPGGSGGGAAPKSDENMQ